MSLKDNIIKIWKAKGQIIEGITNSVFKKKMLKLLHYTE